MLYRGGIGQFSWAIHRLTGLGVLAFLFVHILDTFLLIFGPDIYNKVMAFYRQPMFKLLEVGLIACVLYHGLNGLRITVLDFFLSLMRFHKAFFLMQMLIFFSAMIPVSIIMLSPIFKAAH
jgi:succinate dehydrogenase / fumarate reductase cytochrome b subunit